MSYFCKEFINILEKQGLTRYVTANTIIKDDITYKDGFFYISAGRVVPVETLLQFIILYKKYNSYVFRALRVYHPEYVI